MFPVLRFEIERHACILHIHTLCRSPCLYIGNLSFYTTEEQMCELFGRVGAIDRVIMGLDRNRLTPCGFAFVIYQTRDDADAAVKYLNGYAPPPRTLPYCSAVQCSAVERPLSASRILSIPVEQAFLSIVLNQV